MPSLVTPHFRRGSALLTGLIVMVVVTVLMVTFLEKMTRLGTSSQWIVQSTQAYYRATALIERSLMNTPNLRKQPWTIQPSSTNSAKTGSGTELIVFTGGTSVPAHWKWNSPFNDNYNLIGLGDPVQIVIPDGVDWTNVFFEFNVPKIGTSWTGVDTSVSTLSWVILWTLGGPDGKTLYASGETAAFTFSDLNWSKSISSKNGFYIASDWTESESTFSNFYDNSNSDRLGVLWQNCVAFVCTLKLSLLRSIPVDGWRELPFLEYKIDFSSTNIPNQYMILDSKGYAGGYLRTRHVVIPQITTNTALDFAVLQ